jgi:mono/diheme cytochrome c family protein
MGWLKKTLIGVGGVLGVAALGLGGFVWLKASAYDASLAKVYDIPLPKVERSTDPVVLARGEHIARSLAPCATGDCHGSDLGGGKPAEIGPIGTFAAPNITSGGLGAAYSDAELARLLMHGVKKDGRGVRFMPVHESSWLPQQDVVAAISYVRTVPPQSKSNQGSKVGLLGKVLDQLDMLPIDNARRIDHAHVADGPPPTPDAAYGKYVAKLCTGCHGTGLSGGPIPGAPPEIAIPLNLTPDKTGLAGYSFEEFKGVLQSGKRKQDGRKLDEMMSPAWFGQFDDTELRALYSYLMSLPPKPFGGR